MKYQKMTTFTLAIISALTIALSACTPANESSLIDATSAVASETQENKDNGEVNAELTALELSKLMGNGINLGNTMEAYDGSRSETSVLKDATLFETLWGQPRTTQEMISGMKAAGFDTLRVPVAWTNGMYYESGDYTISESYLNRIEEIINYALNADMYVIINDHWDGGWWGMFGSASEETRKKAMDIYVSMWTQIAERYNKYSDKLIFEGANEELGDRLNDTDIAKDSGKLTKDEAYAKTNEINQVFVDTVRKTGGNNANRFLLIAGYNTDISHTVDNRFKMPTDTAKNKLLISVHYYTPSGYAIMDGISNWGTKRDYEEMNTLLAKMTKFTDQGYGVIFGEYGALPSKASKVKEGTDRYTTNFLDNCDYYNYVPMLWDTNGLYKKSTQTFIDENIGKIFKERSFSAQSSLSDEEIKNKAKKNIDDTAAAAPVSFDNDEILALDDTKAIAWIMYQSEDFSVAYNVGDEYNPASKATGLKANDIYVTGEGTYTVSLDFTKAGKARGVAFSALGIANGEKLFPGYIINIDEIKINGEVFEGEGDFYTTTDDGICTRVNLYNAWVTKVPKEARIAGGDLSKATSTKMNLNKTQVIDTLEITFTYKPA